MTFEDTPGQGLEIKGLSIEGELKGIDLCIRKGECVGIAGLAGSGKEKIAETSRLD